MKAIRFITSGRLTLILIASLSGVYLFVSFKSQEPWLRILTLIRVNILFELLIILFSLHLLFKGIYILSRLKIRRIGSALFFISLSLIVTGMSLSLLSRDTERQKMSVSDKTENGQSVLQIRMDVPDEVIVVGENYKFKIDMVEAVIDDGGRELTLRPFPFVSTSSGYAYINDAGISPSFEVRLGNRMMSFSKLDLLPPGRKESLTLTGDYRLEVSLAESRDIEGNRIGPRRYRLDRPGYMVIIKKSGEEVFEGTLHDNQSMNRDAVGINTGTTREWIEVVFVRDRTVPMLYIGLLCLSLGIILYPLELYYRLYDNSSR